MYRVITSTKGVPLVMSIGGARVACGLEHPSVKMIAFCKARPGYDCEIFPAMNLKGYSTLQLLTKYIGRNHGKPLQSSNVMK